MFQNIKSFFMFASLPAKGVYKVSAKVNKR